MVPMVCSPSYMASMGMIPPMWAVPQFLRHTPPNQLMFRWPDPVDGVSAEAFDKLKSLGPSLREVFLYSWYAFSSLPERAERMACLDSLVKTRFEEVPAL